MWYYSGKIRTVCIPGVVGINVWFGEINKKWRNVIGESNNIIKIDKKK